MNVRRVAQVMRAVHQFDLNERSLAEGDHGGCEKTLTGDYADEPPHESDGFLGES